MWPPKDASSYQQWAEQEGFSRESPEGTRPCLPLAFSPIILISDCQPVGA